MSFYSKLISRIQPTITIRSDGSPEIVFNIKESLSDKDIDSRLLKIAKMKNDLVDAIEALDWLENEGEEKKKRVDDLKRALNELEKNKKITEEALKLDDETFSMILKTANKVSSRINIFIGIIIGLVTGVASSLLVWFLTK
ncbi:MAG: hypothetical protein IH852_01310 [Bacteroidetes bacterium]|nr:hypothetical protein [Bacteroidota bacterium]